MTGPRDWDKELAEIDRLLAAGGGKAAEPAKPVRAGAAPSAPAARPPAAPSRRDTFGVWLRVGLGALLGVAMTQWPYAATCGIGLLLYVGAAGLVPLAGLWAARVTWTRRMGLAHVVSLLVVLWGLVLVAGVLLPRIGYAAASATWLCGG